MRNFKIVLNFSMASPPQLELGSSRVVAPGVCGQATAAELPAYHRAERTYSASHVSVVGERIISFCTPANCFQRSGVYYVKA